MKKYSVEIISEVTGLSDGVIRGYFNNRKVSTAGGLDVEQILGLLKGNRRNRKKPVDKDKVEELRDILKRIGAIEDNG
jgi:hypothetical protein